MKFPTLILFALLSSTYMFGQYKWDGKMYLDKTIIGADERPHQKIGLKGFGDKMRLYIKQKTGDKKQIIIEELNLNNFTVCKTDSIAFDWDEMPYTNYVALDQKDFLISFGRLQAYDRRNGKYASIDLDTINYNDGCKINDSLILLGSTSSYHPADGFAGLNMTSFNSKTMKVVKTRQYQFEGIGLAHMGVNWFTGAGGHIYAITPMSGIVYEFDANLELVGKKNAPIPWTNATENIKFEHKLDVLIYNEWHRLRNLYAKYGKDSIHKNRALATSEYYSKNYDAFVSDTVRKAFEYVEKMLPYNDSMVVISFCRKGYAFKYRDVFLYNVRSNQITKQMPTWSITKKDTCNQFEDYFPIYISNDLNIAPYFKGDKIYYYTVYNPQLFTPGLKKELDKINAEDISKNNYQWHLLEYRLQ
ncbi:hypothetical protein MUY27_00110 [Mucilaginibacter sp. RS28]|uniref:6-bladed beta-propeller protein n=1 Tax=Mucilaginibacter straminoryzae TaxID=2932774 RepID=A0A9X1WYP2_9SPHI|nr:hypothetical protein [Mucilaginibacter straminoryzae]MCJ8208087.1 hypothetical protein [Mucilaginibacter straminoryzae]